MSGSECQKYAVVHELIAGVDRPTVVCSGSLRARVVYLSQSNSIVIETFGGATVHDDDVTTSRHADDMNRFLLQYQGTGLFIFHTHNPSPMWLFSSLLQMSRPTITTVILHSGCVYAEDEE